MTGISKIGKSFLKLIYSYHKHDLTTNGIKIMPIDMQFTWKFFWHKWQIEILYYNKSYWNKARKNKLQRPSLAIPILRFYNQFPSISKEIDEFRPMLSGL